MAATSSSDGELSRRKRRDQYDRLLAIVDHNTGGKQRPMATLHETRTIAGYAGIDVDDVDKRLQAGVEQGDLVIISGRVFLGEEDALRAAAAYEGEREHLRKGRLGAVNTALQEVFDDE